MNRNRVLIVLGVIAAGALISFPPSWAQVSSTIPPLSEVSVTNRVDVSATTPPDTCLAVAGGAGCERLEVDIPNPVTLSQATLNSLNGRTCTLGAQQRQGVDGTVRALPPLPGDGGTGAQAGRTSISLTYHGKTGFLSCYASALDGGVDPTCTTPAAGVVEEGWLLDPGGAGALEISNAYVLRCIHCASNGTPSGSTDPVSYLETSCTSP